MIRCVLTDIEGTTTSISFVHDVLFPYASAHIADYVETHKNDAAVKKYLALTADTLREETNNKHLKDDDLVVLVPALLRWIKEDRKHPGLKGLQGLLWEDGYKKKEYTAHVYPDVPPRLKRWRDDGLLLAIYSSGSVQAQKLLFTHTTEGNLCPLFSAFFDTAVGGKRESASYLAIAQNLELKPAEILFLSDIAEELDAAQDAGLKVIQLLRPGTQPSGRHPQAKDFTQIEPLQ